MTWDLLIILALTVMLARIGESNWIGSLFTACFAFGICKAVTLYFMGWIPETAQTSHQAFVGNFVGFAIPGSLVAFALLRQAFPNIPPLHRIFWRKKDVA